MLVCGNLFLIFIIKFKSATIICCVLFIPPNSKHDYFGKLFDIIEGLTCKYPENKMLISGDFNIASTTQSVLSLCNNMVSFCKFTQLNTIVNSTGSILDLVLCNFKDNISLKSDILLLISVDKYHPALLVQLELSL